jgi:hypothetical protein
MFHSSGELFINVFFGGLITIAVFAILVSKNSNTGSVLNSAGSAVSSSLYAAEGQKAA